MTVLITGSRGMLGSDIVNCAIQRGLEIIPCGVEEFDITDRIQAKEFICKSKPSVVIHSAAYTDVDGCESKKEIAYDVNVTGTANIVKVCHELNIPLAYISTDYVFDGNSSVGYTEASKPNPINYYGYTKNLAEKIIQQELGKYYIVRTSWLFGKNGKNFVKTISAKALSSKELFVVDDQKGCPTYTADLAKAILSLINTEKYGIYHLTNSGYCTWHMFASNIIEELNFDCKVVPIKTSELDRAASRPLCSILDNSRWLKEGFAPLRNYREALKEYLNIE